MITQLHQDLATILEDIWLNIDWQKVKGSRKMSIWSEFEGQIQIRANQHSNVAEFLTKLCDRMDSELKSENTEKILNQYQDYEILNAFRNQTQIPLLLLKLRREKNQAQYQQYIDLKPELEAKGINSFSQAKAENLFEN
jgi:hypothetical protein